MSIGPGFSAAIRNSPCIVRDDRSFRAGVRFGRVDGGARKAAPVPSTTVPVSVPVPPCANALVALARQSKTTRIASCQTKRHVRHRALLLPPLPDK